MNAGMPSSPSWSCPFCDGGGDTPSATCNTCGFSSTQDDRGIHRVSHDKGNVGYPEDGNASFAEMEEGSFWFLHRNELIQGLMARFRIENVLLDVGGGNGFQAAILQNIHPPTVLVEPSLFGCRKARERGVKKVINGTLESIRVSPGGIGAICFLDVIEHLSDPAPVLRKAHSLLGKEGKLIVTVPAYDFLWSNEDEYARHCRRYTRHSLQSLLGDAGFKSEYLSYCFQALVLPILAIRSIPYRLGLRRASKPNSGEHRANGLLGSALLWALSREARLIRNGGKLPFGSSLIAVASKREV